ncbi:MAG: 16S rRNA (cytidine(1402)-2'-O)-methyltransferase [Desulfamplus sp.]|nr:16S rRNA (cytidine(1402)-2'-O)-methyltransferase [Desulfamplus sp.]
MDNQLSLDNEKADIDIDIHDLERTHFLDTSLTGSTIAGSTLYVVATPIGNLEDITFRAIRVLNEVHLIAAEDTRHTSKLLSHYQIQTPLISCYEHNEESRIDTLVRNLSEGFDLALVSDAGTPLISDPGYRVVKGVIEAGFKVIPIPGPCAAIAGLSVSGLPTDSFIFAGFPNRKQGKRIAALEELLETLKDKKYTIIFYESPHRIIKLIEDIVAVMGDRPAMVGREITKHYEEYLRGPLSHILSELKSRKAIKGECALFVASNIVGSYNRERVNSITKETYDHTDSNFDSDSLQSIYNEIDNIIITELESSEMKTSSLAKALSRKYNLPRQEIYSRILKLQ